MAEPGPSHAPRDLAAELLAADDAQRDALIAAADPADLARAIAALGRQRDARAAVILHHLDARVPSRELRKAARRELHRLRSMGITADPPTAAAAAAATETAAASAAGRRDAELASARAWVSYVDPAGCRSLWLVGERSLGGAWLAALVLCDQEGVAELELGDTSRRRALEQVEDVGRRTGTPLVEVPLTYALALVREANDVARARGAGLPPLHPRFREVFGEADAPPERPLAYERVSPMEARLNPTWLEQGFRLLRERELLGWHLPASDDLGVRALEVVRSERATLLVPGRDPLTLARGLMRQAARDLLTPTMRHTLRRRLEEMAYLFAESDRPEAARLAVAAAAAVADASVPVERQPLVQAMLMTGLARSVRRERVGDRPASEVLLELLEEALEERSGEPPEGTATSGGLILPR